MGFWSLEKTSPLEPQCCWPLASIRSTDKGQWVGSSSQWEGWAALGTFPLSSQCIVTWNLLRPTEGPVTLQSTDVSPKKGSILEGMMYCIVMKMSRTGWLWKKREEYLLPLCLYHPDNKWTLVAWQPWEFFVTNMHESVGWSFPQNWIRDLNIQFFFLMDRKFSAGLSSY